MRLPLAPSAYASALLFYRFPLSTQLSILRVLWCPAYAGARNDKWPVFPPLWERAYLSALSTISRLTSTIPFATLLQQMGGTKRVLGSQSQLSLSKQTTNNSHSWKSASVVVVFPFAFGSVC